jgi:hypothetical protein
MARRKTRLAAGYQGFSGVALPLRAAGLGCGSGFAGLP